MAITQLDCFRATVAHQPHEGILTFLNYTPDLERRLRAKYALPEGKTLAEHFGMFEPVGITPKSVNEAEVPDTSAYYRDVEIPEGVTTNPWGVLRLPGDYYHFTRMVSPLRNADSMQAIRDYPYRQVESYDVDSMARLVNEAHKQHRVAQGPVGHIFETSWQIRGMEPFLMEMVTDPERCDYIFDRVYEHQKAKACALAQAGVDYIHTGDDVATQQAMMFGIDYWRRFLKTRWADIYAAVRAIKPDIHIFYHSDGNIDPIIPELIEIGVDILNPVQPECMDPFHIKREFGKDVVLFGCLGTQSLMPFGTPDDIRTTIHRYARELGSDGALILAPTHVLEPEVPIVNIETVVETVREYGDIQGEF